MKVSVIGAGLAGCEAAYQLSKRGISVELYEMKPTLYSPAHKSPLFAELVCSNSLRSNQIENAVGLLKEEMRILDSLIINSAYNNSVPAGGALAVDREGFSKEITEIIKSDTNIKVISKEVTEIDLSENVIIATGPLTSDKFSTFISSIVNEDYLYFYDAAAPIVLYESINHEKVFKASRYGKGNGDEYINCPMNKDEYEKFYSELINAEVAHIKEFEEEVHFEGCMPVETMACRGRDTLLYGPLKPVGLINPKDDKKPYAVVQLRQDNKEGSMYNIVGFQTHLKWGEQKRVFGLIPGLENCEFVRYGVMHRNTYINSPKLLNKYYQVKKYPNIMLAGQITGVEGYVESASSGLVAGINMANLIFGKELIDFSKETAIGALSNYVSDESIVNFQPMNVNFALISSLKIKVKNKQERNKLIADRAINNLMNIIEKEEML
jgi:methylenetetrahydrofolate--tRNA-(uracil-5-)-methyltransferase